MLTERPGVPSTILHCLLLYFYGLQMLFWVQGPYSLILSTGCWQYRKLLYVLHHIYVWRGFVRAIHNSVCMKREVYECLWLQWTMEAHSVWPVIAGKASATRACWSLTLSHTRTHTQNCWHRDTYTHIHSPWWVEQTHVLSSHIGKISVRLHNEAVFFFLPPPPLHFVSPSLPALNALLPWVEMTEFISNSPGRTVLRLSVYSGRKLI